MGSEYEMNLSGNKISFVLDGEAVSSVGLDMPGRSYIFDGFMFNVCVKGDMVIGINGHSHHVVAHTLFVVLPKHVCSVLEHSPDIDVRTVFIPPEFICDTPVAPDFDLLKRIGDGPCIEIGADDEADILKIFSIIGRYDSEGGIPERIKRSLMLAMVLIGASLFKESLAVSEPACSRPEAMVRRFFELVYQYFGRERRVRFYADRLFVTPKYLSMTVKSATGHSAQEWINEAVLFEAKRYIRTTDMTIQQISETLLFSDPSSFVRFFRTHTGITPLEFRRGKPNG